MHLVTIKKYSLNKSAISPQLKTPLEILQKAKGWLSEAYDENNTSGGKATNSQIT